MEAGFYFAYDLDMTSNAQRRSKFMKEDTDLFDPFASMDLRYVWNNSLYKQMRV